MQEEIFKEFFQDQKMLSDTKQKQFIKINNDWIKGNMSKIITDQAIANNSNIIVDQLKKYFKNFKVNKQFTNLNFYDKTHYSSNHNQNALIETKSLTNKRRMILNNYRNRSGSFCKILNIWRKNATLNVHLFNLVRLIIVQKKKNYCENCRSVINLSSVCQTNIRDLFTEYKRRSKNWMLNNTMNNNGEFDLIGFKVFVMDNAKIVTFCSICQINRLKIRKILFSMSD